MIVGVPEFAELHDTAVGWLNLAWEIAIREVLEFQEAGVLFRDMAEAHGPERAEEEAQKYWSTAKYKLNNAVLLLQQSLEIELKARIAKVSPYLLIAGDPQSWPKMDKVGQVDFSDFKTLDSTHLCRVHDIVSDRPLSPQFTQFYSNVRKARNKIAHLNAGNMKAKSSEILLTILTAHGYLYEKGKWMDFRRQYTLTEQKGGPNFDYDEDFTNDNLNREFDAVRWELEPRHLREFFGYDVRKQGLVCFNCLDQRTSWCDREWDFAQRQRGGGVKCVVCSHQYTDVQYKELADEAARELEEQKQKYGPGALARLERTPPPTVSSPLPSSDDETPL
jgi:hypothetical protein